ncbi:MAG: 4a-hydroxytetrahydrobiopterin dehydratase [Actinomycetota bacterium]|nr:4a-hydroxytetrahydrobiopterin dehydratase [Actinomycetota bacterium]
MELIDAPAVAASIAGLAWTIDSGALVKVVRRDDFAGALRFVNAVGELAESAGHHPDVDIRWGTVTLRLSTHSLGGITDADVDLARRIDDLA